jgi:PAS domain S-box-containing protein
MERRNFSKKDGHPSQMDRIKQFDAIFNQPVIGIIVTDKAGKILNFNPCAESQFGFTRKEISGKDIEILIPKQFHSSHVQQREIYYQQPKPRQMGHGRDLWGFKKDQTQFPVEVSLNHYYVDEEMYVMAFVADITHRKESESLILRQKEELENIAAKFRKLNIQLEQKVKERTTKLQETLDMLAKSKEELDKALENEKELNELKSRFVTMASHEFRTPLSTILSSAFLLQKYNDNPDAYEQRNKHIKRIKNAVAGLKSILEDFLSLGKLDEGVIGIFIEQLAANEFGQLIANAVEDMEQVLKTGQRIEIEYRVHSSVRIDKNILNNILLNLLSNAIKFSGEDSVINVSCVLQANELLIAVKDEGIGIPEEDQQYLFNRFFRARNAINIQGTGLGLHIVAQYVELMKGSIKIQSELGKGTSLVIRIPQV